jgi:hypothetical protein
MRTLCMTLAYVGCRLSEALALTADCDPWEITARILGICEESGFRQVTEHSAGGGGQPITIELIFPNDEIIRFDGIDWYHRRR